MRCGLQSSISALLQDHTATYTATVGYCLFGLCSATVCSWVLLRNTEGTVQRVEDAKVTVFGCGIEASATEAKGTVLIRSAEELMNYNKSEEKLMEEVRVTHLETLEATAQPACERCCAVSVQAAASERFVVIIKIVYTCDCRSTAVQRCAADTSAVYERAVAAVRRMQ
eukprot:9181-Heterococcus_DN1.PRE.3